MIESQTAEIPEHKKRLHEFHRNELTVTAENIKEHYTIIQQMLVHKIASRWADEKIDGLDRCQFLIKECKDSVKALTTLANVAASDRGSRASNCPS